jgi:Cu/Ag efflux protein CusF
MTADTSRRALLAAALLAPLAAAAQAAGADADMASGEVRRINKEQNKITLRHGEIKSLEMPPMTMVFTVRDPKLLDAVKVGDKVLFRAAKEDGGTYVVTAIKPAP